MSWQEKLDTYLTPRRQRAVFITLLIFYALFLTYHINEPFIGTFSGFNGFFGIAARNWIQLGPAATDFGMMTPYGAEIPSIREFAQGFYLNHPQLFIAPLAFIYWIFGAGSWQTRLFPIIFSLLAFTMFWKLLERVFKKPWLTAISSFFYVFFPISIYYGRLVVQDPVVLFFILALFLAGICFEEERTKKYLYWICAAVFFGGLMDFQFFLAVAALFGYIIIKRNYPDRLKTLLLISGASVISLAITLFQVGIITQINPFYYFFVVFSHRAGGNPSILQWLILWGNFNLINFTEIALLLAAVGAVLYISKETKERILFAAVLVFPGLVNTLLFRKIAVFDQYWSMYLIPFVALMAAWAVGRIRRASMVYLVLILFAGSTLVYTGALLAYQTFALDDFALTARANTLVPQTKGICMGDPPPTNTHDFYLFPHPLHYFPCPPDDAYFLLRTSQSYLDQPPLLQWLFSNGIVTNLQRTNFISALIIEAMKTIPPLEAKVKQMLARYEPRQSNIRFAGHVAATIAEYHLQPIACATNICLYKKE